MDKSRYRNFSFITYIPADELKQILVRNSNVRHFAFIVHDKDINSDGEVIASHIHLLLRLTNACTKSAVLKYFRDNITKQNTFVETIKSDNIFNYLTHDGFEDKFQYSDKDIISDDISFWPDFSSDNSSDDRAVNIIEDIIKGVDMFTLAKRYGRDLIINYDKYLKFAKCACSEKRSNDHFQKLIDSGVLTEE